MTDAELLHIYVEANDQDAFASLVRRYESLVWSVCARQLVNRCDREDAFQTTFLILAKNANKIRRPDSLSSWLHGTAWKVSSRIRKRRATRWLEPKVAESLVASESSTLEVVAKQFELDALDRQLQAMHEKDRTPLILHYIAGLTAKQIANKLNLTPAAIEGRIRRARARLKAGLRSEGIVLSPVLLLGFAACGTGCNPEFVSSTIQLCVETVGGSAASISMTSLKTGAKYMICKSICAVAITGILAAGGLLGGGLQQQPRAAVVITDVNPQTKTVSTASEAVALAIGNEMPVCPLMTSVGICCDWCDAVHTKIGTLHDQLVSFAGLHTN